MSGPYRLVTGIEDGRGGAVWRIEGPTIVPTAFKHKGEAELHVACLNAAYAAGQAGGGDIERKALDRGWRTFWDAFSDHLRLGYEQRTYGWHDLIDAESKGIKAVQALLAPQADKDQT